MIRIICIGNPYFETDSLGARVYDILSQMKLPPHVEIIDGGLAGLNLLSLMDDCERIVFVDTILSNEPSRVQVLHADDVESDATYGHGGGLEYLLGAYRALGAGPDTSVFVVGAGRVESAQGVAEAALSAACGEELYL